MKSYILTDHERDVIKKFLKTGVKKKSISVYLVRAKRYFSNLKNDLELLERLLKS